MADEPFDVRKGSDEDLLNWYGGALILLEQVINGRPHPMKVVEQAQLAQEACREEILRRMKSLCWRVKVQVAEVTQD